MTGKNFPLPSRRGLIVLIVSSILLAAAYLSSGLPGFPPAATQPTPPAESGAAPLPPATPLAAAPTATPLAIAPVPAATPSPRPSPTAARFSASEALQHLQVLAGTIGQRPSGSPASSRTAQYIQGQLASFGYDARLQPYRSDTLDERFTQVRLSQPEALEIGAKAFVYSASGNVDGRLVDCGLGRPADYPTGSIKGQIALIERGGNVTFTDKSTTAVARGAAGAIIYNDRVGDFRGSLEKQFSIPVVGILQNDGKRLQEMVRRATVTLTLRTDAVSRSIQGTNVVSALKPTPGRKKVVIGAHYDSVSTPGANDNASGVATLLQLASLTRGQRYPFDLVFVAFGDEELGLIGSRQYLELTPQQERAQINAMINLDMVGVGSTLEFGGDGDLVKRMLRISGTLGYPARELVRPSVGSDHASFLEKGIPAVFVHRAEDPNYHTAQDTAEHVEASNLEAAGNVVLRLLSELTP